VLAVVGTRPEAIKVAPVVLRLRREPEVFSVTV
jgi:UDP-N-acetylglucosamine 2-epimerase